MARKSEFSKRIIAISMFIFIAASFLTTACTVEDDVLTDIDRIAKVLTTTKKTDVFVVGKDIDFDNKVTAIKIDEVSTESISGTGDYKVIIVNDLENTVSLSEKEIAFLKDLISKDGYLLIYLGEKYSKTWDNPSYGIAYSEDELSFIYYSWGGFAKRVTGSWCREDQDSDSKYPLLLGQSILYSIENWLK